MPNYIDLPSLGPTEALAVLRVRLLGLSGTLLPRDERGNALYALKRGDSVTCMPSAYAYWRRLASDIPIVNAEDTAVQDDPKKRIDNWLEWSLVQLGVRNAAALVKSPPNTEKHQHYAKWIEAKNSVYIDALLFDVQKPLPSDLETVGTMIEEERPYTWRLVEHEAHYEILAREFYECGSPVGVDVETDIAGSEPNETRDVLVGVGLAFGTRCFYGQASDNRFMSVIKSFLPKVPVVPWNAKYDLTVLRRHGITPGPLYGDGMLAAYLAGEHRAALKPYVLRMYGARMIEYNDVTGGGKTKISEIDPNETAEYCCGDAFWALKAEADLRTKLNPKALALYEKTDLPMVDTIVDMELAGIKLDRESAEEALVKIAGDEDTAGELTNLARAINALARVSGFVLPATRMVCKGCRNGKNKKLTCETCNGEGEFFVTDPINPGSSHQLVQWLHGHLKIPLQALSQKTQQPSVSSLALLRMQHQHAAIPLILHWRTLERYRQFLEDWLAEADEEDRIHTSFTLAYTHSGRLSSRDPNLQQLALPWRKHFIADDGEILVGADYHMLEVRVAAFVSRDSGLLRVVNHDPHTEEGDLHAQNVHALFGISYEEQMAPTFKKGLRVGAKGDFFGALYGSKGFEVKEVLEKRILQDPFLGEPQSLKEIIHGIQLIKSKYSHFFYEWVPFTIQRAREQGNVVYTIFGRPRVVPDLTSGDKAKREAAERVVISMIIQGTAADIVRMAMNGVSRLGDGRLRLSIHDELLSTVGLSLVDNYIPKMVECMELGQPLDGVPLVVDVGVGWDWEETHK